MSSLRDVLARRRYLIVALAVAGAGAAFGFSRAQEPVYEASSSISMRDTNVDLSLVGLPPVASQTADQLASTSAQTVASIDTLNEVRRRLRTTASTADLAGSVSATVDAESNLIDITASAPDAAFAASLASELARVAVRRTNEAVRSRYGRAARELRARRDALGTGSTNEIRRVTLTEQVSRLDSLSVVAEPAQLVELAGVPSGAASPKPVFNSVLGLALGLMIGVGAAFLLQGRDLRLHSQRDIAEASGLPILGTVRDEVLGGLPFTSAMPTDAEHKAVAGFGILRRQVELTGVTSAPRVIAVTSAVPEEGKTTVSASLASAFASVGRTTLLLECDLRRPTLAARYDFARTPGLGDFLEGRADVEQVIRELPMPRAGVDGTLPTLNCVPAGDVRSGADEVLASDRFRQFVVYARAHYDVVIIDTPPLLPVADTLEVLPTVDAYILCARLSRTTRRQVEQALSAISALSKGPAGLVVTGATHHDERELGYAYGYDYRTYADSGATKMPHRRPVAIVEGEQPARRAGAGPS